MPPINEIEIQQLSTGQVVAEVQVDQGLPGPPNTLAIGSVTSGTTAAATISGTAPNQTLNLVLPKGDQGDAGADGADALWNFRGEWVGSQNEVYDVGDIATYNGSLWYCLNYINGTEGFDPESYVGIYWQLIAAKGSQGDQGEVGETGPANTLTVSSVTTGAAGSSATVTLGGTAPNQTISFSIPRGDKGETGDTGLKGDKGDKGDTGNTGSAATISLGTVTTGAAGSSVSITNSGTSGAAVFDFTIPRGDQGIQGIQGDQGIQGIQGPEPSLNVVDNAGTSITLADGDNNTIVRCTAATAVTITVPSTLAAGFSCMVIQAGTGQVTFQAGSGATLNSFGNLLKTAGQHAPASIIRVGAGIYNLSGNLA